MAEGRFLRLARRSVSDTNQIESTHPEYVSQSLLRQRIEIKLSLNNSRKTKLYKLGFGEGFVPAVSVVRVQSCLKRLQRGGR